MPSLENTQMHIQDKATYLAVTLKRISFLMSLFVFWLLYMRSTFPGTELDFLLKLTRQPKNNLPLEREGVGRGGEEKVRKE